MIAKCKEIVKQFMPSSVKLIKHYKIKTYFCSLWKLKKIMDINNPIVEANLEDIVINQTEALVAFWKIYKK